MPSRRGFLASLLSSAVATATLDVERLLWIPGEKVYFDIAYPPVELITPQWVVQDVLRHFEQQLRFLEAVNRPWDGVVGDTVTVRLPRRWSSA